MLILPAKPFSTIRKFLNDNRYTVSKFLVKKIITAIHKNVDTIELFQIRRNTKLNYIATAKRKDYHTILEGAMHDCVVAEDYETAARIRDGIQLLKTQEVDRFLSKSTG